MWYKDKTRSPNLIVMPLPTASHADECSSPLGNPDGRVGTYACSEETGTMRKRAKLGRYRAQYTLHRAYFSSTITATKNHPLHAFAPSSGLPTFL